MKFFLDIVLVSAVSLGQSLSLITFYGVKPNFALAVLAVLALSAKEFWKYLILVLASLVFLNYTIIISKEIFSFGALMMLAFYLKKYLSENIFLNSFLLVFALTMLLYLLIDPGFIFNNFNIFILELFYNALAGLIFGFIYKGSHGKE